MASSAPRATARSSRITGMPRARFDETTRAGSASAQSTASTANRAGSSLAASTTNEPSRPCGLPTRPTLTKPPSDEALFGNLEQHAAVRPRSGGTRESPQRLHHAPAPPDHLAAVRLGDVQPQQQVPVRIELLDPDRLRVVDDLLRQEADELGGDGHAGHSNSRDVLGLQQTHDRLR